LVFKTVLKIIRKKIAWNEPAKRKLKAFREVMNGKVIEITMRANPKNKTSDQHNFLWLIISRLGKYLGYGDLKVFEYDFKESIGMFEYREVENIRTKEKKVEKHQISITKLNFEQTSNWIELGLCLCDHMEFPMRALYDEYKAQHRYK